MIGLPEAAARLGISRQRAHILIQEGKLKAERVGAVWIVEEQEVDRLNRERQKEKAPEGA